jgi:1-acyl-sn-glycerol-3-phosphate acyltransferase
VFWWLAKLIIGSWLKIVIRPWSEGTENVPRRGPVVLVFNHMSFSDHLVGPLPLPRRVVFLAKAEYFNGKGIKGLATKAFFKGVGCVPIDRSGGAAADAAMRTGLEQLAAGRILGIYPEGTRSPDGRLYKGKTGVARLALESRAPVIPAAMIGTFEFQPPGQRKFNRKIKPGVKFGKPIDFSRFYGQASDRKVLRQVTDEIMHQIQELSGQEYVDAYAKRVKEEESEADE